MSAIDLVLEFLEAKKFDNTASALRKDLEAMQSALLPDATSAEKPKPVEREFSQLESLLVRSKAAETGNLAEAPPAYLMAGGALAKPGTDGAKEDKEDNLPEWHDPKADVEEDEWTDDEALGYSRQPY